MAWWSCWTEYHAVRGHPTWGHQWRCRLLQLPQYGRELPSENSYQHQSGPRSPPTTVVMTRTYHGITFLYSGHSGTSDTFLINTLRPRRNEQHFADDIFKRIFFNENVWISIKISLKFVPKGPINNIPALVQIMVWRRSGDKPLSEPVMVSLLTHICVTRPQWVKVTLGCLCWKPGSNSFWVWAKPMKDDVTLLRSLSLVEPIPRMISETRPT